MLQKLYFFNTLVKTVALNPKPFLHELTGKTIFVKLKLGQEYKGDALTTNAEFLPLLARIGILLATDSYMNLQVKIGMSTCLMLIFRA